MSRALLCVAAIAFAATAAPALAESPFNGTWRGDTKSAQLSRKPDVQLLKNGTYTCTTCTPPLTVKADGQWHKVTGHSYYDEVMVKVVDARTVSDAYRRAGKDVSGSTETVSADGKTLTAKWHSSDNANGTATSGTVTQARVGAQPAGAHAISGSWRTTDVANISEEALRFSFNVTGDTVNAKMGTGESYAAKFGGPAVMMQGDPGNTMVQVKKIDDRSFVETDRRKGKVVNTYTFTAAPDGKSLTMTNRMADGGTIKVTAYKQ